MNWLRTLRTRQGVTQKQISEAINISRPYYCMIEAGKRTPNVPVAQKIAKVLNFEWSRFYDCTVDELLTDPEDNENNGELREA